MNSGVGDDPSKDDVAEPSLSSAPEGQPALAGEASLPPLVLERLLVRDLRNLTHAQLQPAPRLNVLSGANGQGKTSVLEAIYLLATSRSFRTAKLGELVRHGAPSALARGSFQELLEDGQPIVHEQSCAVAHGRRTLRIDGSLPASGAAYATRCPVVVFEPQQLALTTGSASVRRTLLDRVCLFLVGPYAADRARYRHALDARGALLSTGADSAGLVAFESLLAQHGAALTQARQLAAAELARRATVAYRTFGAPNQTLCVAYQPGGSDDPQRARQRLAALRGVDVRRRRTTFGPHLDELVVELDGHLLRTVGSQGQHRAVTLALKIAELGCIAAARRAQPLLLLDDVSSELDEQRAAALFAHLATTRCQIFLTTTRRGLIVAPGLDGAERSDFELLGGTLRAL